MSSAWDTEEPISTEDLKTLLEKSLIRKQDEITIKEEPNKIWLSLDRREWKLRLTGNEI
ncbi:hypothetical protein JNUCC42_04200 [Brevibacterium sp. JNUCC-42]|nr:hypothetical protein JNUCC42_04200 [Brevibacterium sp. JNUCC-42]